MIAQKIFVLDESIIWITSLCLAFLSAGNIYGAIVIGIKRATSNNDEDAAKSKGKPETAVYSPLRPPRSLARERVINVSSSAYSSPFQRPASTMVFESRDRVLPIGHETMDIPSSSPFSSPSSPIFEKVYGFPITKGAEPTSEDITPLKQKGWPKVEYALALSSPLPDTGSPRVNKIATGNLPQWTEQLRNTILDHQSSLAINSTPTKKKEVLDTVESMVSPPRLQRRVVEPDLALVELGLAGNIESITEKLRLWIGHKIIKPLAADIVIVATEFSKNGMEYLSPHFPATFSLFSSVSSRINTDYIRNGSSMMITPATISSFSKPQTLMELGQKYPQSEIVKKRLRIERYLSFSSLSSHRAAVVRRINELADDNPLESFKWNVPSFNSELSSLQQPQQYHEDSQLLVNLFCSFMDENLPSEILHEIQPYSSRYFVTPDGSVSNRLDAIQLHQSQQSPPHFRLIAGDRIYEGFPGVHNLFHAIIFMVEYVHRRYNGFLGVGNLDSPAIDLISILDTA